MRRPRRIESARLLVVLLASAAICGISAQDAPPTSDVVQRFLAHPSELHTYDAVRHLEASSLGHRGWIDAKTHYSPTDGFVYTVIASGGSAFIDNHVLRPILEREKEMIESGDSSKSALDGTNYDFRESNGIADGLTRILMHPKRREETLIDGSALVVPDSGSIVKLEGRLAKSPSFWVKHADVVRSYAVVGGATVPVRLESIADIRLFGRALLTMTYDYSSIDGRAVAVP
jgi:hypothetical protein